jgi:hypothetical protein
MQRKSHNKSAMRQRTCFQRVGDRFGPTAKKESANNLVEHTKQGVISGSHRVRTMRVHDIGRAGQGADRFGQASMYTDDCPDHIHIKPKSQKLEPSHNVLSSEVWESWAVRDCVLVRQTTIPTTPVNLSFSPSAGARDL